MADAISPPHGFDEIITTFGDITHYIDSYGTLSPAWQTVTLSYAELPFALPLSWNPSIHVSRIRCHHLLVPVFTDVFGKIADQGLKLRSFGGCFEFRQQRTGAKLSTHAWAIAIDLDSATNQQGTVGDMDPGVVKIFKDAGFEWGGDWEGRVKDPMHLQWATGY